MATKMIAMKYQIHGRTLKLGAVSTIRLLLLPNDRKASLMRSMFDVLKSSTPFAGARFYPLYRTVYYPEVTVNKAAPNA